MPANVDQHKSGTYAELAHEADRMEQAVTAMIGAHQAEMHSAHMSTRIGSALGPAGAEQTVRSLCAPNEFGSVSAPSGTVGITPAR